MKNDVFFHNILFVLTLISLPGVLSTCLFLLGHDISGGRLLIGALLWLPIPIAAIGVGLRYQGTEIENKELIWGGYITAMLFLFMVMGGVMS